MKLQWRGMNLMDEKLNSLFYQIRDSILNLMQEKNVDVDILLYDLGIDKNTFIQNLNTRIDDFTFYLQTLSLLENWEV